jgi:hypothetical protein
MSRCKPHFPKRQAVCYIFRNQVATARGSNRRHVSIQSEGMLQLLPSCELLLANAGYLQRSYANTIASCHAEADGGFMADARQTNGSVRTWKPFDLAQRQRLICTLQNNFSVHCSHLPQPIRYCLRIKSYTRPDPERWDPPRLRLLEDRDFRNAEQLGELFGRHGALDALDVFGEKRFVEAINGRKRTRKKKP